MKASENKPFAKQEIYVNEIEFRSRQEVYLFGFLHHCGQFIETQYVISRKDLQLLLSQGRPACLAGRQAGIEILWQIENLFVYPHQVPASLNLIELFGTTQVFEAQEIRLDAPPYPGGNLLFIDEVIPFSSPEPRKLKRRDTGTRHLLNHL